LSRQYATRILLANVLWLGAGARPVAAQTPAPTPPSAPLSANPPPPTTDALNRGIFSELWVVPVATKRFQGAGLSLGYERSWLAALYRIGFVQNDYAPFDSTSLQRTRRIFLDLEVDAQWRLPGLNVTGGGGVVLLDDRVETATPLGASWEMSAKTTDRLRPIVNVGIVGPLFQTDATFTLGSNPEFRLALGIKLGRNVRRRPGT
jgi:hypothetical protein